MRILPARAFHHRSVHAGQLNGRLRLDAVAQLDAAHEGGKPVGRHRLGIVAAFDHGRRSQLRDEQTDCRGIVKAGGRTGAGEPFAFWAV